MAFKFFNIGKANAEIDRLTALLVASDVRIAELAANEPEALTALNGELTETKNKLETSVSALSAATSELEKVKAELVTAKAAAANVEKLTSEKALAITQAQGQSGAAKISAAGEANAAKTMTRTSFNALTPVEQSKFCKNGGKLTD